MPHRLLLASLLLLAVPAQAMAATARVDRPATGGRAPSGPAIVVEAAPGEVNDIRIDHQPGYGALIVRDLGAPLAGAGACEQLDDHAIRCARDAEIAVVAGDGNDRVRGGTSARGGPGDDTLEAMSSAHGDDGDDVITNAHIGAGDAGDDHLSRTTSQSSGSLDGGPGDDVVRDLDGRSVLKPGPGRDVVEGGGGDDTIVDEDADPGADRLDGGRGRDVLHFHDREAGATIDLGAQSSSDGDAIGGFEDAEGGRGDDVLVGSAAANTLGGGPGNDRLAGGEGDDELTGGEGFDRFDGGPGDDRLDALYTYRLSLSGTAAPSGAIDASPEPLTCGPGHDRIAGLYEDVVAADCERLPLGLRAQPLAVRGRSAVFEISCPRYVRWRGRCRGTVTVSGTQRALYELPLARGRFRLRGRPGRVRVRPLGESSSGGTAIVTVRYVQGAQRHITRWIMPRLG